MHVFYPGGDFVEVNGTLIWYYNICKREVWLMSRNIVPDQHNENIDLGKFLHENSFSRKKKEISFGSVKFDVILDTKDKLVIGETKKSSKYEAASKWQMMFYLKTLKDAGINAEGVMLYPEEKRRDEVLLDDSSIQALNDMILDIDSIIEKEEPPKVEKCKYCKNCGYLEYCYA